MSARSSATPELGLTRRMTIAGFTIKEFAQPPYRQLPWHEHKDASICFVVSGSYTERARGLESECTPHSMVFKPAFEGHTNRFGRFGARCLLMEINPGRLESAGPCSGITATPGLLRNAKLASIGHQIHREFTWGDAFSPLAIEGLILEVIVEGARSRVDEPATQRPVWLRQAHELIHDSFREPLTLSTVASAVGIHPAHLARTFRKHYQCSIGAYVRRLRIELAARELTGTTVSLAEIGLRSGFFDQSHFSRTFKEQLGLTPAQFRAASRAGSSERFIDRGLAQGPGGVCRRNSHAKPRRAS